MSDLDIEPRMLIDGELTEAASGRRYDNVNPATEAVIGVSSHCGLNEASSEVTAMNPAPRSIEAATKNWTNEAVGSRISHLFRSSSRSF